MAKIVDITERLSFDENPSLKIKEKVIEVNSDAPSMLKVMGLMSKKDPEIGEILEAYETLFPEKSRKEIEKLKINFKDLVVVIQEGIALITGDPVGE